MRALSILSWLLIRDDARFAPSLLLIAMMACGIARADGDEARPTPLAAKQETPEEVLLQVDINGQGLDETAFMLKMRSEKAGADDFFATAEDLQRWRLHLPSEAPRRHNGQDYFRLSAIAGAQVAFDERSQSLAITLPAAAFLPWVTEDKGKTQRPMVKPSLGGFFNYELMATTTAGTTGYTGLFEGALFNRLGVGVATFLGQDSEGLRRLTRLDTTWTHDRPESLASLRAGDAVSRGGSWGRAVRFGGLQYATNFATQPNLVTMPMHNASGTAVLPSTVDVYVNNMLSSRREVPPGPFSINNIPVVTGSGDVRVVVRDMMGREQVISQPFYQSASVLARGREDFSYEVGALRRNYGLADGDYGGWMASGTHRKGLSDSFTGELRAEAQAGRQTLGLGGALMMMPLGVINAALATGRGAGQSGKLGALGFEHQGYLFSLGAYTQVSTPGFSPLGVEAGRPAPQRISNYHAGLNLGMVGSLGVAYVTQANRETDKVRIASASFSTGFDPFGFLGVSVGRSLGPKGGLAFGVNWTLPLGPRTATMVNINKMDGKGESFVQFQQAAPAGEGTGYQVQAGDAGSVRAALTMQTNTGSYGVDAASQRGQTATRLMASGGITFLGGSVHASRKITDSFALVQVPGYPGVRVYADNQLVGVTDEKGEALLPRLRAYERNPISIEQLDLPYDATVGALALEAEPFFRAGTVLPFAVARSYGAVVTLRLETGDDLPAGAVVTIVGRPDAFPVGYGGQVYLTGLQAHNRLKVVWGEQGCELSVDYPEAVNPGDPVPNLGTYVCKGIKP